jgi:hypothetical protein
MRSQEELQTAVGVIGEKLGLGVEMDYKCGRTIWGAERKINVLFTRKIGEEVRRLGILCINQDGGGSARLSFYGRRMDTLEYPVRGLVVYGGAGFGDVFEGVMSGLGAVSIDGLENWLRLYFGLPLAG